MRKHWKWVCLMIFGLSVLQHSVTAGEDGTVSNPLFAEFNQMMELSRLNKEHIANATTTIIEQSKKSLETIYAIKKENRTFDNTLLALDNIQNDFGKVTYLVYLMNNVQPDADIRDQARASFGDLDKFSTDMGLDEQLYKAMKEYSETAEAKKLTGYKKRFLDETLRDFERNGFALSKEKRDELKTIQNKLSDLSIAFSKNIADYKDFLIVSEKEMDGLPEDYKKPRKQEDGTYKIDLSYPSYSGFMKSSNSESARKALYTKYMNRASDKNLDVLKEMLVYRQKLASLLGYKTFAQYQTETRMAKNPKNVWDFENRLIDKIKVKAKKDYDELLDVKRKQLNDQTISVVQPWESSYYNNILLKEKYQLDQEKLKEYFEINNVMSGLFQIAQTLFDVTFDEIKNPSVWHQDVRAFEVKQNGKIIGRFYFDLFPRDNKFTHAACFAMVKGKTTANGYQIPSATLVCNFPKPTADQPALMYHALGSASVTTFFHEFGHVLHNMLTQSDLYSYAGTAVARDFVEAPSQIFENWAWNYDALKMFARHYKTNEILPKDLFDRMVASKNVGSGIGTAYQVFYGVLDMTLHDQYDPNGKETTTEVVKRLQEKILLYPYLEGTAFQAGFGHLTGYAAGYYGYLWAEVYAQDMFSVFAKNGIMDKKTGKRYRDIILAKGGTEDPLELVKQFIGREPNEDAFLKSLGL